MTQSIESHVSATLLSETGIAQQDGWNTTNFTMENIILRLVASLSHTVGGCGFLWNWGVGGKRTSRVVGNLEAQWENAARMNGHWLALVSSGTSAAAGRRYLCRCRVFGTAWYLYWYFNFVFVYFSCLWNCIGYFSLCILWYYICVVLPVSGQVVLRSSASWQEAADCSAEASTVTPSPEKTQWKFAMPLWKTSKMQRYTGFVWWGSSWQLCCDVTLRHLSGKRSWLEAEEHISVSPNCTFLFQVICRAMWDKR